MASISGVESYNEYVEPRDARDKDFQPNVSIYQDIIPAEMENFTKKHISERVELINTTGHVSKVRVDHCIDVTGPSDAYRNAQTHIWKIAADSSKRNAWTAGIVMVIGFVAALFTGTTASNRTTPGNGDWIGLVVSLGAAAGGALFTAIFASKASSASELADLWSHSPALAVAEERRLCYAKGLTHAYWYRDKNVLTSSEKEYLFKAFLPAFCTNLLEKTPKSTQYEKKCWVENFLYFNPVSWDVLQWSYGHEGKIPEYLKPAAQDLARCQTTIRDIRNSYGDLRTQVNTHYEQLIASTNEQRNALLKPWSDVRNANITAAKTNRDLELDKYPSSTAPERKKAWENYEAIKGVCEQDYQKKVAEIDEANQFPQKVQKLEADRKNHLEHLVGRESDQIANNFAAAYDLLSRIRDAWINQNYRSFNFQQYFYPWQVQQPVPVQVYPVQQPVYYVQPQPVYAPAPVYVQPVVYA